MPAAETDRLAREAVDFAPALQERPVEPARLVVLAVRVVVAPLRAAELVAAEHHGHALRSHEHGPEVLHLALPEGDHEGVLGLALGAAVPTEVVVHAVAVALAVVLVVLLVVRREVPEGEPVVARHEVDAVVRRAAVVLVQIRAAADPGGDGGRQAVIAPHESAHVVAVARVPLGPAPRGGERAHLIKAGGIPRLGDDLAVRQDRVVDDALQEGRVAEHAAVLGAAEDGGQVEAKAVDVHLHDPEPEAVENEVAHQGMVAVEGVAAAGVVAVIAPVVVQHVVDRVVEAAEAERRPHVVALGGVVVDHVEDDLDAGAV